VPFSETDSVDQPISPYGATKKACELMCYTFSHLHGIDTTCLRYFTVYGPRQRPDLAIHKFARRILNDEPIDMYGDESSSRDYTHIDDIIDGTTAAIDRCEGYEIINLGSKHPISLKDMIATIEKACDKKAKINQCDRMPGDVERTFADVDKAFRLLGYVPSVDFEEGVKNFVGWLRSR
jgi:UDP-glucuronate 4-epimerase